MSPSPKYITALINKTLVRDPARDEILKALISTIDEKLYDLEWLIINRKVDVDEQTFEFVNLFLKIDQEAINATRLHYVKLGWKHMSFFLHSGEKNQGEPELFNILLVGPV